MSLHRLCKRCAAAGIVLLLACALLTVGDILSRRLLGVSVPGLIDLTQLLVMSSVFLCIPFALERRAKVEVDPTAPALVLTVRGAGYKAAREADGAAGPG